MDGLTRHNPLLPRPKNDVNPAADPFAVDCKSAPDRIADLVRESLAPNTRTAYLSDLAHFASWGGRIHTGDTYITVQGNADDNAMAQFKQEIAQLKAEIPARAVAAINLAKQQRRA